MTGQYIPMTLQKAILHQLHIQTEQYTILDMMETTGLEPLLILTITPRPTPMTMPEG